VVVKGQKGGIIKGEGYDLMRFKKMPRKKVVYVMFKERAQGGLRKPIPKQVGCGKKTGELTTAETEKSRWITSSKSNGTEFTKVRRTNVR